MDDELYARELRRFTRRNERIAAVLLALGGLLVLALNLLAAYGRHHAWLFR